MTTLTLKTNPMKNFKDSKICGKCNVEKLFIEFTKHKLGKYGLQSACKECRNEKAKEYRENNKEKIKEVSKQYKENNKEYHKEYNTEYFKKRKLNDPLFKFKCNLRSLICISIRGKGYKKNSKTFNILGCEYSFFMKYMEAQFKDGMTWENHGEWHIDHITPMYAAQTEEETLELNHYTNLQPLWAAENLFKSNKIITKKFKLL